MILLVLPLLSFSWSGPAAFFTVLGIGLGILTGAITGGIKLWKASVQWSNRIKVLTALAEKELQPNSGSSMKDAVTNAARDAAEALTIAKDTQNDVGVLKDQFTAFSIAQTSEQQNQWAQIRKIGHA